MKSIIALALAIAACTPAQQAETTQIENTVLTDIKAGKTAEQIETDVAAIVIPGQAGADIVMITNDAITLLIDLGLIPETLLASTKTMQATLAQKHLAGAKR